MSSNKAPVNDAIIVAVARLVDDAQSGTREPSHSDLEFQINRAGLSGGDPKGQGQVVGKAKRVRAVLSWGIDNAPDKAEAFVAALIALVRGKGGFRDGSSNFVGEEAIVDARESFRLEGYVLSDEGELYASTLENLSGAQMTVALEAYVRRAQRGSEDGALLVGTGRFDRKCRTANTCSKGVNGAFIVNQPLIRREFFHQRQKGVFYRAL